MHIIEAHVPQFLDQKHFCFFLKTRRGAAYRPHGFLQYNVDVKFLQVFIQNFAGILEF